MPIAIWIPGAPVGVPRPRARHIPGPDGGFTHIYTPSSAAYKAWRQALQLIAGLGLNRPEAPLEGPVRVDLVFMMPRPACYSRKKDPEGPIWAPSNPNDFDNLSKSVDVLTKLNYWHDDRQVCDARVRKCFHAKGGSPGALFVVARIDGEPNDLPREIPGVGDKRGTVGDLFAGVPVDRTGAVDRAEPVDPDDDFDDVDDD